MADWLTIKTEYITTDTSYRKLAQKYGVNATNIAKKASAEGWVEQRKQFAIKTLSKTVNKSSSKTADKMVRIDGLADKLLKKLEQAIDELDTQLYRHTDKTKVIEYNNDRRPDKPTKEIVHEEEKLLEAKSIVDRQGLRQISAALKDIKEIKMLKSELDRQEQEARIANLRKQADKSDDNKEPIQVVLGDELSEYSR